MIGIGDCSHDRAQCLGVLLARHRAANDVRPGLRDTLDLRQRGRQIGRLGLRHRLHHNRRSATDCDASDMDLPLGRHSPERIGVVSIPTFSQPAAATSCRPIWFLLDMPYTKRLLKALAACGLAGALFVSAASASTTQVAIMQDNGRLSVNPTATLLEMKDLGATTVKFAVYWTDYAPDPSSSKAPKGFNATNPADYNASAMSILDAVVRGATADGLKVYLQIQGPTPFWADGPGALSNAKGHWEPNATDFKEFVEALGTRYSGKYKPAGQSSPLPRVGTWSIWNEPNYGPDLAPQGLKNNTIDEGAISYRNLLDAGWSGLHATGHGSDTFLIGETAPRGISTGGEPGELGGTKPILFLASLYCSTVAGKRLTGTAAKNEDCPSSASTFRRENPALFDASGFAEHPYSQGVAPNLPTYACGQTFCWNATTKKSDPYYADFAEIPRLESDLDKWNRANGSGKKYLIYNTEFGYWTPPSTAPHTLNTTTAAYYMNWAEYISYENPRIASYEQYQVYDPAGTAWTDGLFTVGGTPKATLNAWELPLYMPTVVASKPTSLTVWGAARPAVTDLSAYGQVQIQFAPLGATSYTTVENVPIKNVRGYFDVKVPFTTSGTVRLAWTGGKAPIYSRLQAVTIK